MKKDKKILEKDKLLREVEKEQRKEASHLLKESIEKNI